MTTALEVEGLGEHADGADALLARRRGDNRGRAGTRAAAHACGHEHHVGAVEQLQDLRQRFFRRLASDLRSRSRTEALGDGDAELHATIGQGWAERVGVGIGDDELDAFQGRADHVVDGIAARTTDADDGDTRLNLRLLLGEAEVDGHLGSPRKRGGYLLGAMMRAGSGEALHHHWLFWFLSTACRNSALLHNILPK